MHDGGEVSYSEKHFSNVFAGPFSLSAPQFTHSCKCTHYLTKRAAQDAVLLLNHSLLSLEASGVFSVLFCQKHFGCTIKHSLYTPCRNQAQIQKSSTCFPNLLSSPQVWHSHTITHGNPLVQNKQ